MWERVLNAIKDFFAWLLSLFADMRDAAIQWVTDSIPDWIPDKLSVVEPYYNFVNSWVPVDFFFICLTVYIQFYMYLLTLRWVKSFVPTIAN